MTEVMREEVRKNVQVFKSRLTMQDIIEGREPNSPNDWNDLYNEYCEYMKEKEDYKFHVKRHDFCLTDVGSQINLQWLDEYSK